ncbi:carbohydrate ABC transporter permease [Halobaculum gomorrense]|uniref:Carbohydrate ABC transporter membrane protein 2, CUT1 family n=1 Tax=Halobaculum gomorrense TaxID=43928 RepID=A0A1M5JKN7_9EURY|nr:carbohydrate ABC transporter permease [Halobaculum gomorrense]SHG41146.1 carbohydrate ABC transporter membrane protein 2, CUT1 family [Halobaculum gomorrense]
MNDESIQTGDTTTRADGGTPAVDRREFDFESSENGLNWEQHIKPVAKYVSLAVLVAVMLFPVYYAFANSLKTPEQIFTSPLGIPWVTFDPAAWSEMAWNTMWEAFPFVEYTLATFIVSVGTAGLATVSAVFAAYAFARLDFPLKNTLFVLSVAGFLFPVVLLAIPIFVLMQQLGLLNTYLGMILAFTAFTLPYNVWLLRGFFEDLPDNLEESARVDGCTQIGAFFRVILPLSRPALASVFLLAFLLAWHNYVMAFIIGSDELHTTLAPALIELKGTFFVANFHYIMAATFLTMLVPMLMYMYLQKYLVEGLTSGGGVKG